MTPSRAKELVFKFFSGDGRSLARLITLIENREENVDLVLSKLYPHTGNAYLIGVTGPPGAGKSTIVDKLISLARKKNKRVAVLCVDPSSPFSGGAILGDRIRMQAHAGDEGVFIRSIGTRGGRGGVSRSSQEVVMLLDAAGFDWVILETAGVGQTELGVLGIAHTTVVALVPESGDGIQMMKAGILEIADVLVVNKCDRTGADYIVKELSANLELGSSQKSDWSIPVLKTIAERGEGLGDLYSALEGHYSFLKKSEKMAAKIQHFAYTAVLNIVCDMAANGTSAFLKKEKGRELIKRVALKKLDPFSAAEELLDSGNIV